MGSKCYDLLNQYKIPGSCGFPLANPHSGESVDFVPDANIINDSDELCIGRSNLKYLKAKNRGC